MSLDDPDLLDRNDPDGEISRRGKAYRNWGRWGEDDVLGTLNFIDAAKRQQAAAWCVMATSPPFRSLST